MDKRDKRGALIAENIVFIVLNFVFLTILVLFIYSQAGGAILLEESYAKNIALVIDSANPGRHGMDIYLDMEKAVKKAEKSEFPLEDIVKIDKNVVTVKTTIESGYSYSFFNDVDVKVNFDKINNRGFRFTIKEK